MVDSHHMAQRWTLYIKTLMLGQNGRHFTDDILKYISLNEDVWILIKISLKFVPKGQINNIPALVQIMALHWPGDSPLSEPMLVSLLMHICISQPQWVKIIRPHESESTLAQVMACCLMAPSHYLNQCFPLYCQSGLDVIPQGTSQHLHFSLVFTVWYRFNSNI